MPAHHCIQNPDSVGLESDAESLNTSPICHLMPDNAAVDYGSSCVDLWSETTFAELRTQTNEHANAGKHVTPRSRTYVSEQIST